MGSAVQAQFADTCTGSGAQLVAAGSHAFDLRTIPTANNTGAPSCAPEAPSFEQWLTYVPVASGVAFISFDSLVEGPATVAVLSFGCDFPAFSSECRNSDDPCSPSGLMKLGITAGMPVIIQVSGRGTGRPHGSLLIVENPASPPGDICESALAAQIGSNTYSAADSVQSLYPGGGCYGFDDVWFVYVPAADGGIEASICGQPGSGGAIALYSSCDPVVALDCGNINDDNFAYPPCRARGRVNAGEPVYIQLTQNCYQTSQFTLALVPGAIPANDDCANAQVVTEGNTVLNNTYASTDGGDPCSGDPFGFQSGRDVWCSFTPDQTAQYDFAVGFSSDGLTVPIQAVATALFASCSDADPSSPLSIACDSGGFSYTYFRVSLSADATYLIRLAGAGRPQDGSPWGRGEINLNIRRVVPPANDTCSSATPVGEGEFAFDLRDATADGAPACSGTTPAPDVWFLYTPTFTGLAEIGLVPDPDFPPTLGVTSAEVTIGGQCDGSAPTDAAGTGYDSMTGAVLSRLVVQVTAGQSVRIRVAAEVPFPALANGRLYAGPVRTPAPPVNDSCATAIPVSYLASTVFSLADSTKAAPPCYPSDNCFQDNPDPCTTAINDDLFYSFVAPRSGTADIHVHDGELYPYGGAVIAVLDSCSTSASPTFCGLACGDAPADVLRFPMVAGQSYIIRLGTYVGSATASGTLTITCPADFNGGGGVSVQDIFDFLSAYFADSPAADFNGSGSVSVQDIFDFLGAYFGGC